MKKATATIYSALDSRVPQGLVAPGEDPVLGDAAPVEAVGHVDLVRDLDAAALAAAALHAVGDDHIVAFVKLGDLDPVVVEVLQPLAGEGAKRLVAAKDVS